jgi:hypothetical protein
MPEVKWRLKPLFSGNETTNCRSSAACYAAGFRTELKRERRIFLVGLRVFKREEREKRDD